MRLARGEGGETLIVSIEEALRLAAAEGLDLVEVGPGQVPPVCRIMNFGRFRYMQSKREKEHKRATKSVNRVGIVRLTPQISDNDLASKSKVIKNMLAKGSKVRVEVVLKGRQKGRPESVKEVMRSVVEEMNEIGRLDAPPRIEGRGVSMTLTPIGSTAKPQRDPADQNDPIAEPT